jgi:hypothetical protein
MIRNTASQTISASLVSRTDGSAVTSGTTTVYVTKDAGTQATGAGTVTHEGNGEWSYVPTQGETDAVHVAFTFTNSTAVQATVNVYTRPSGTGFPSVDASNRVDVGKFLSNTVLAASGGRVRTTLDGVGNYMVAMDAIAESTSTTTYVDVDLSGLVGSDPTTFAYAAFGDLVGSVILCGGLAPRLIESVALVSGTVYRCTLDWALPVAPATDSALSIIKLPLAGLSASGRVKRATLVDTATTTTTATNLTNLPTIPANWLTAAGIAADTGLKPQDQGTAQAGASTSITLRSGASSSDNFYTGCIVVIVGGTGAGQSKLIRGYTGAARLASINGAWVTTPDATSVYAVLPLGATVDAANGNISVNLATIQANAITAASINAAALNGKGDWNIGKTGYALTATTGLGNQTANITGTITTATNVTTVNGLAANVVTAASIATDAITAAKIAADAGTEIGTAVWATTTRLLTAGTNIALAKGTGVTGFNDLSAAQVNAEVDTALTDIHLDHLLATDYDPASKPGVSTALFNELIESDAGVSRYTANALEQAPSGTGASASAIADEVQTRTIAAVTTVGSVTGNVGGISGITFPTNFASLGINASGHITRAVLVDTATALTTNNDKTGYSLANNAVNSNTFQSTFSLSTQNLTNAPTGSGGGASAATIAAAVWDEAIAGHLANGSTGAALNNAGGTNTGSGDASQATLNRVLKIVQAQAGSD